MTNAPRMSAPTLQIRSNLIIEYTPPKEGTNKNRAMQDRLTANIVNQETYTGRLCPGAKKRLFKAVEVLIQSTKDRVIYNPVIGFEHPFHLNFITLTVHSPDRMISGREAYKTLLSPFLQWFRRSKGCTSYIWKAELQERGQIHYHITSDTYIHKDELRAKWNELQRKAGYLDIYFEKKGHYNAPSAHVKAVRKIANMAGYIKKRIDTWDKKSNIRNEITKTVQNIESVGGKVWDCSLNLKRGSYFITDLEYGYGRKLQQLIVEGKVVQSRAERCIVYKFIDRPAYMLLSYHDKIAYFKHMRDIAENKVLGKSKRTANSIVEQVMKPPKPPPQSENNYQSSLNFKWNSYIY